MVTKKSKPDKEIKVEDDSFENLQLKKRIADLEKQLKDAELKAIAFSTMVDIAEKEFKIPIRKKAQYQTIEVMKNNFSHIGLAKLWNSYVYKTGLLSEQLGRNIHNYRRRFNNHQVDEIRKNHRRMGTRKLYELLQPFILEHQLKIGRDALFNILSANHLLVRKRKRRIQTTNSYHWLRKYPNLIREFVPTAVNQLWVSDITYWKIDTGEHLYISFITDASYFHPSCRLSSSRNNGSDRSLQALRNGSLWLGARAICCTPIQ